MSSNEPVWMTVAEVQVGDVVWNASEGEGYPVVRLVPLQLPVTARPDDDPYAPPAGGLVDCVVVHTLRAEWADEEPAVARPVVVRGADVRIADTPIQIVRPAKRL